MNYLYYISLKINNPLLINKLDINLILTSNQDSKIYRLKESVYVRKIQLTVSMFLSFLYTIFIIKRNLFKANGGG